MGVLKIWDCEKKLGGELRELSAQIFVLHLYMVGEDETWTRNIRRHCKTARVLLQYYRPTFLNAGRPPCFISLGPIKMLLGLRGGNSIDSKNPTQNPAMVLKLYTPKARFNAEMFFF